MKTMTCKQFGGVCNKKFQAETFDEIAELAKNHGIEMYMRMDKAHMEAINKMRKLSEDKEAMQKWLDKKKKEFDALPND